MSSVQSFFFIHLIMRGYVFWMICSLLLNGLSSGFAQDFSEDFSTLNTNSVWTQVDRGDLSVTEGVLALKDCHIYAGFDTWDNYEMEFMARAPLSAADVRIFASFRYNSDQSRYVFGLRGGNNNDLFLSRIGADNNSLLLAIEPLDFIPQKGQWYKVRIQIDGSNIQVFLNDEPEARLRAVDSSAPFSTGRIALGGGWDPVEFDYVKVRPVAGYVFHSNVIRYNFQCIEDDSVPRWTPVDESLYLKEKGYGWREEGLFTRKRGVSSDVLFDTLVGFSEVGSKIFLVDLPDGDYVVSVSMGDPSHPSKNRLFFMDEQQPSVNGISGVGQSVLLRKSITTHGGQLRMRFEMDVPGPGVSMNWIAIEKREDVGEQTWTKYLKMERDTNLAAKEALRKTQRATYQPIRIDRFAPTRSIHSLNGNWLFIPDYEVKKNKFPWDPSVKDDTWHIMSVPDFWTPVWNWTYTDDDIAKGSANWVEMEKARCEALTFDYEKAKVGYYKQRILLPEELKGRTIQLHFESIAKCARIWVNGTLVTIHQGMFAPIDVDITRLVNPGENTVVVQAGDSADLESGDNTIQGVAVSVEVTSKMLNSLPHGMFKGLNRGIWQDVSLVVSGPVTIDDTFFKPQMNHFDLDVTVRNRMDTGAMYSMAAQIREKKSNKLVYDHHELSRRVDVPLASGAVHTKSLSSQDSKHASFERWSPEIPNLYTADIFLYNYNQNSAVDLKSFHSGAVKLNFQPLSTPRVDGWTPIDGSVYQAARGYGWSEAMETQDRNATGDQLFDTVVLAKPESQSVFKCNVANGDYVVTLQFGDPNQASLAEAYVGANVNDINQAIVRDFVKAGASLVVIKSLTVTDGILAITVPGLPARGERTSLNYLVIEKREQVSAAKWTLGLKHFNILDHVNYNAGFRTFTVSGDDFLLNGRPYKMRGANHNPNLIRPNDKKLANWFMKTIHNGNINFTRSHANPFNEIWLNAADEQGVAVSQEGTWPWLCLYGKNMPDPALVSIWQKEWLALIKKHKNHPSILLWTMNNEMKLWSTHNEKPWRMLSDAVKAVRELDPTRPVVADSGNCRKYVENKGGQYSGVDDGDVDDHHYYPNWYDNNTFFGIRDGHSFTEDRTPGRPFISQEFSTGYPDTDAGHPVKHYIYTHMNPQTLVGKWAYEHRDPSYWLKRHALISKESCEAIRTGYRDTCAGIQIFALCTWFQNLYDVEKIQPYPTFEAVSQAWEPVQVMAKLMGRHFYTGSSNTITAVIVNDSPRYETLNQIAVNWDIVSDKRVLQTGSKKISGSLEYDRNLEEKLTFMMPATLSKSKVDAKILFKLSANGRVIATNSYDIVICDKSYAASSNLTVGYFTQNDTLSPILSRTGVKYDVVNDLTNLTEKSYDVLVLHDLKSIPAGYDNVLKYAEAGGQVLLSMNRHLVLDLLPNELRGSTFESKEIVTPCAYEKSIFDGIHPDELSWFTGTENSTDSTNVGFTPIACERAYNVNYVDHVTLLAETMRIHGYFNRSEKNGYHPNLTFDQVYGSPLIEIRKGRGRIIVSSMYFQTPEDPIAHKLLSNTLRYLAD